MKKLFIITTDSNYGEFVRIVCADNAEEAWEISGCKELNWDKNIQELSTDTKGIKFDGGGDRG